MSDTGRKTAIIACGGLGALLQLVGLLVTGGGGYLAGFFFAVTCTYLAWLLVDAQEAARIGFMAAKRALKAVEMSKLLLAFEKGEIDRDEVYRRLEAIEGEPAKATDLPELALTGDIDDWEKQVRKVVRANLQA
jgi:hypothetical protein